MNIDELRSEINGMEGVPVRDRAAQLREVVQKLLGDITAAKKRGVTWPKLADALSRHVGYKVRHGSVSRLYSSMKPAAKGNRVESATVGLVEVPANVTLDMPRPIPNMKSAVKHLSVLTAENLMDGRLFQLDSVSDIPGYPGVWFRVHEVDAKGKLTVVRVEGLPTKSKDDAMQIFRAWTDEHGYDIDVDG